MSALKERIEAARKAVVGARERMAQGGFREPPAGEYQAVLEALEPRKTSNGYMMVKRDFRIIDAANEELIGMIARDWQGVENDVGMSIMCEFLAKCGYVKDNGNYLDPAYVFDLDKSEKEGELIYGKDFILACQELSESKIKCNILVTKSQYNGRDRTNVRVLEISEASTPESIKTDEPVPTTVGEIKENTAAGVSDGDVWLEQMIDFSVEQDLDVKDSMTFEEVKALIAEFEYPAADVTDADMEAKGFKKGEYDLSNPLTDDQIKLLEEIGLGSCIIRHTAEEKSKRIPRKK